MFVGPVPRPLIAGRGLGLLMFCADPLGGAEQFENPGKPGNEVESGSDPEVDLVLQGRNGSAHKLINQ